MSEPTSVFLRHGSTGELVPAALFDGILPQHLEQVDRHWKPLLQSRHEEHGHWDWRTKVDDYGDQLAYQSFALECGGMVQGLMIVNTTKRCRLAEQINQHLVYVEYLESAPWNRVGSIGDPPYKGVGLVLLAAAIDLSIEEGNRGRVGLHSLPQAEPFYARCGMSDLGPDTRYPGHPLRYFEMTSEQAERFLIEGIGS